VPWISLWTWDTHEFLDNLDNPKNGGPKVIALVSNFSKKFLEYTFCFLPGK